LFPVGSALLLGQLKRLGLSAAPKLAIGDGSLGFWIALQEEIWPGRQQRCWVHKTANILENAQERSGHFIQSLKLRSQAPKVRVVIARWPTRSHD
jgi:transposase-like protein